MAAYLGSGERTPLASSLGRWLHVSVPEHLVGMVTDGSGFIVAADPRLRWLLGKHVEHLARYVQRRKGLMVTAGYW